MGYQVIARKWRPQVFEDVVGQDHVTRTLKNAVVSDRIAQAYLFVGPRGIGKTSIARIFAKSLNCLAGEKGVPCGECDSCVHITAGTSMDVIEIDGASNNGVEQVRELCEAARYMPGRGRFRIYIIDEVHMLSSSAFNALLKTLEEPPDHVKFMFATTEVHKVLPTIISRCQRFDLRRIPLGLIVERLRLIAEKEGVQVDDDALLALARAADGGLRDAQSALDQVISFKGANITEDDVLSVFGLVSRSSLEQMAGAIIRGEASVLFDVVSELDGLGRDFHRVIAELIGHFRNLLVLMNATGWDGGGELSEDQLRILGEQAAMTDTARVMRVMDILSNAEEKMRYAISRRLVMETAMIKCARAANVATMEELMRAVSDLRGRVAGGGAVPESGSVRDEDVQPSTGAPADAGKPPARRAPVRRAAGPAAVEGVDETGVLVARWNDIKLELGRRQIVLKGVLNDARPVAVSGSVVNIGFDPEFKEERERCAEPRNKRALELEIGRHLRRQVTVEFSDLEAGAVEQGAGEAADDDSNHPAQPSGGAAGPASGRTNAQWMDDPAVRKASDLLGGTIVDVRA